jgi:GNAT superfamily N-acetyltransferase
VIEQENRATVDRVRSLALSPRLRQTYRPSGSWTPGVIGQLPTGRVERLELGGRPLIVRERVPLSMVRRLRVAPDMHAFTKDAQREARLLRRLAERSDTNLTVAHTPEGEIVAEVSMAPADGRWADVDGVYEIAIEVARGWRGVGLGEAMLKFVLSADFAEDLVLIALGLSWHWDLEAMKLTPEAYRTILLKTFEPSGFRVYTTDDPEINAGPGNVLLARVGSRVPSELYDEFYRRLDRRADWFGF